jgi:hypothetical protein
MDERTGAPVPPRKPLPYGFLLVVGIAAGLGAGTLINQLEIGIVAGIILGIVAEHVQKFRG